MKKLSFYSKEFRIVAMIKDGKKLLLEIVESTNENIIYEVAIPIEFLYECKGGNKYALITNIGVLYTDDVFLGNLFSDGTEKELTLKNINFLICITKVKKEDDGPYLREMDLKLLQILTINEYRDKIQHIALLESREGDQFLIPKIKVGVSANSVFLNYYKDGKYLATRQNECVRCAVSNINTHYIGSNLNLERCQCIDIDAIKVTKSLGTKK